MEHAQFLAIDDRLKGEYNAAKKLGSLVTMTKVLREMGDLYEYYLHHNNLDEPFKEW